jgi:hypothetical protein
LRPCSPDGGCGEVDPETEIDARTLMCDAPIGSDLPLDDLAQAVVGMHPADVWVTRLEANLPRAALDADLVLEPALVQLEQRSTLQANVGTNVWETCELALAPPKPARTQGSRGGRIGVALCLVAVATLAALRRGVRRTARPATAGGARS